MSETVDRMVQDASPLDEVRLLATELRSRWRTGERVCVESLGERFELLSCDDDRLLDLLYHELLIREEYGDQPTVDEYIERFPQLTEQLQRQFEVHSAVDQHWTGDGFEPDSAMLDASDYGATLNGESASRHRRQLPIEVSPPPGYELLEEIGRGGMAVVFKARQQNLNRLVALKMILAGPLAGEQVLARLQQEAKAIAQLQHAGIVQIHEVGEHHGLPFLSLEYVPGGTLQQWLNGRPLPIETAAWLIESLARTMHFAHERGVIHRDLKPANILLSGEWRVGSGKSGWSSQQRKPNDDSELSRTQNMAKGDGSGGLVLRGHEDVSEVRTLRTDQPNPSSSHIHPSGHRGGTGEAAHERVSQLPQYREGIVERIGNSSDSERASRLAAGREASGASRSGRRDQPNARGTSHFTRSEINNGRTPNPSLTPPHSPLPTLKISDFGLARLLDGDSELTTTGQVIGTPSYMAPEQAGQSNVSASPAPDIYSLGAILYEALTGRPPFQGATILQTLEQVQQQEPVPPKQLQPRIPPDLETICLKCLEKSPSRRYSTALELADDLGRFQRNESITARPSGWIERGRKWIRRRPAVAALLALIAVLTVGGWAEILHEVRRANDAAKQASNSEADARRDRDQANEQRRIADVERQNAREAQARAETNFLHAIDVVRRVSQVGQQLRYEPLQQRTSSLLFDTTLEFFENVLVERGDDPAVRYQAAGAFLRAGDIRMVLGQHDKAAKQFARAVRLLDAPTDEPHRLPCLRDLATALRLQGNNSRQEGAIVVAEAAYRRCIEVNESLAKLQPNDINPPVHQANARVNLCVILNSTGREAESETVYREAAEILRRTVARSAGSNWCQQELSLCLDDYGNLLRTLGRVAEADPLIAEAYEIRKKIWEAEPHSRDYRILLARSLRSLARAKVADRHWDLAAKHLEDAEGLLFPVLSAFPDQAEVRHDALATIRAHIHLDQHRPESSTPDATLGIELHLLNICFLYAPLDVSLASEIGDAAQRFGDRLWERGVMPDARSHYAHAMLHFKKALELLPDNPRLLARSAWLHAVCPLTDLRDLPLSLKQAQRAVARDAAYAFAWQSLGAAELRASNFAAAETALRKALELSDANSAQHLESKALLVQSLHLQSHTEDAERELTELTKRQPTTSPQFTRLLAEVHEALGKPTAPSSAP